MAFENRLQTADLIVLVVGILVSLFTGIFYSYKERKHVSSYFYHRGGGKLSAIPVAMSMLVTFESSIFFLGYPSEVYIHGFIYCWINIGMAIGCSMMFFITIPLFYPLQITSVFEYLEMRHESLMIRQLAMWLSTLFMILYAGIVIFGAATAMESVTSLSAWVYIVAMILIAVVYTALGGLKAVVVTDVVQGVIMLVVIVAVLIYGTISVGGIGTVIDINSRTGRMKVFDFDPNPFTRHTFWTLAVGSALRSVGLSCRPPVIQRLNSTKSIQEARKVAAISIPGFVILQILVMFQGLIAYAYFTKKGCDPLASGQIANSNQIMSFTVLKMFESVPGVTGLFLAALCSASLSTISSLFSSVSAIISEDLIKPRWPTMSEKKLTNISKLVVVLNGLVCIGVGLLISYIKGPVNQIAASILGAIDGPMNAIFFLSIFIKFTTRKGLIASTVVGLCLALWISLGYSFSPGRKKTPWLPLGPTDKCYPDEEIFTNFTTDYPFSPGEARMTNMSLYENTTVDPSITDLNPLRASTNDLKGVDNLYSISYLYFSFMISFCAILAGLLVSKCSKNDKPAKVPKHLMLPLNLRLFKCLPNYADLIADGKESAANNGEELVEMHTATDKT